MLITLAIVILILLAVFVGVAVVVGLLVVVWQRLRPEKQHDELLEELLDQQEHRRQEK